MPTDRELTIVIRAKNLAEKDLQDLKTQVSQFGGTMKTSAEQSEASFQSTLRTIGSVRQAIFRVNFVWGATFGAMIGLVVNAAKEVERLGGLSAQLGMSVEDVSKRLYGFSLNVEELNRALRQWDLLNQDIKGGLLKIGQSFAPVIENFRAFFFWMGQLSVGSQNSFGVAKKEMESLEVATRSTNRELELQAKIKQDSIRVNQGILGVELSALRSRYREELFLATGNAEMQKKIQENYRKDYQQTQYTFLRTVNFQAQAWNQSWSIMTRTFDSFLDSVFNGGTIRARDLFRGFVQDILKMWFSMIAQMIARALLLRILGFLSPVPALAQMAIQVGMPAFAPTSTPLGSGAFTSQVPSLQGSGGAMSSSSGFQHGTSYVPRKGMYMLHGGEEVVPAGDESRKSGGDNYFIQITALDSRSFVEMLERHPEAITAIVSKDIILNRGIRKTIRQYT